MNPILPNKYHIPDAEARQWKDGRIYIYGSMDISGDSFYCSKEYRVFSSSDLENWTDHGTSLKEDMVLFAPDCIFKDGRYWLYYCRMDGYEGVAVSDVPEGPFEDSQPVTPADGDAIDPAAFVDDDGQAYYFWGQFNLRGGKLSSDMKTVTDVNESLLNEKDHGFHEGACIRKREGIYYMVFTDTSRGKATSLGYATANSPLGPYTKRGIIIDNDGCDKETWNNHGSIAEFNGDWFVFYHRSSQGSKYSRRACIEPISFLPDGTILEVEMTTQGVSEPLDAFKPIDAWRACLLNGNIQTEQLQIDNNLSEYLTFIENGNWACYKYLDFGTGATGFSVIAASFCKEGNIKVRIDSPEGDVIGTLKITDTGGWHNWQEFFGQIKKTKGVHALYLEFESWPGKMFNFKEFKFNI